jgi:iron complex transport system substrate-binding protein
MFAIGAADRLVAVTHECDHPDAARSLPHVTSARIDPSMESAEIDRLVRQQLDDSGTLYALDMELVRELRPELVLTQQLCTVCAVGYETVHAAMRSLPDPPLVLNLEPRTLPEVFESVVTVGTTIGTPESAEALVTTLRNQLGAIPPLPVRPRVLFLEWLVPPFSAGHWMAELIRAAGAVPVLADDGTHSHAIAWDQIRAADFDVVVISCCGFGVERTLEDVRGSVELRELLAARPGLRTIVFDGNHFFSRPGPRLVESARLLNDALAGRSPREVPSSVPDPFIEIDPGNLD